MRCYFLFLVEDMYVVNFLYFCGVFVNKSVKYVMGFSIIVYYFFVSL